MSKDNSEELQKKLKSLESQNTTTYNKASDLYNKINLLGKNITKSISAHNRNKIITHEYRKLRTDIKNTLKNQNIKMLLTNYLNARQHSLTESQYQFAPKERSQVNTLDSTQSKTLPNTKKLDMPTTNPTTYKQIKDPFGYILQRHPHLQKDEKALKQFLKNHHIDLKYYEEYKKNNQKAFKQLDIILEEQQQKTKPDNQSKTSTNQPAWLSKDLKIQTKAIRSKHGNFLKNHKLSQTKPNTSRWTTTIKKWLSKPWNTKNSSKSRK